MMSSLRLAFLAGTFLTAQGAAQADPRLQPARFVCNGDGRCFETGELDRREDPERYAPRDFDEPRRYEERRRRDRDRDDDDED